MMHGLKYTLPYTHLLSLLQAVLYEPYLTGISHHLQPPVRTYNIPFKTILSSALGLPTLDIGGRKGLITSHSKSPIPLNPIQTALRKRPK